MKLRKEFDSIGSINVPSDKYWGASTQRSNKFFNIGKILVNKAIKNKKGKKITVEVDTIEQLRSILGLKFNTILLDNMNIKNLRNAVKIAKKYYETEASGNVTLKTVKIIASTGVDRISVGSITHSASAVDFKLEI